jgi:hypothetical protein
MLLDAWKATPWHGRTQCGLLLRILKVYRKRIHSGYIQYTYRGFYNNRRGFISMSITTRNAEGFTPTAKGDGDRETSGVLNTTE